MPRSELEALLAWVEAWLEGTPPANVWIGATVVNQEEADRDIPKLLAVPAAKRFLSMEPLLGPVDVTPFLWGKHETVDDVCQNCPRDADCECGYHTRTALKLPALHWVIVGGESGNGARPLNVAWVRRVVEQCREQRVPVFVKQLGRRPTMESGLVPLRLNHRKGADPSEWPEDLRAQQFPEVRHA